MNKDQNDKIMGMTVIMKELELRMYFFVPYNISPIQQAIQAGHAALEYAHKYGTHENYLDFIKNWKTWIILNGGTTNSTRDFEGISAGSLNQIGDALLEKNIDFSYFEEPDLNNALTALCFICDERVFNYKDYPEFYDWILNQDLLDDSEEKLLSFTVSIRDTKEEQKEKLPTYYKVWENTVMGGEKNVFLRELLKGKKLA